MICPNCGNFITIKEEYQPFYHWEDECTYYELVDVGKCDKCGIVNRNGEWNIPANLKPTQKQERTVHFIENRLNVYYNPEVELKRNCSDFIAKYFEKAKQEEPLFDFTEEDCDALGLDVSMFY